MPSSHWDAAIVVVKKPDGRILGVSKGRDIRDLNLPGGNREPEDASPEATARRELKEETGILATNLRPLGVLEPLGRGGRRVFVYEACVWQGYLTPSSEGFPLWVQPWNLLKVGCSFREQARLVLTQ